MKKIILIPALLLTVAVMAFVSGAAYSDKATPTPLAFVIGAKSTATRTPTPVITATPTATPTATSTQGPTATDTDTPLPTNTPGAVVTPYPSAPLCAGHDNSTFHTLWNSAQGCHYSHEHGEDPFTQAVTNTFPGFDLFALLGNVQIGHTNPSSPMENSHKHGGMKWQVQTTTPRGCFLGFESAAVGVDAAAIQYHAFGDYAIEFEARIHSTAALLRQCMPGSNDYGYVYIVQWQDYGQRVTPYQGTILPFPDTPAPAYNSGLGPYLTVDCVGDAVVGCRPSREFVLDRNINANSIWTSKGGHTSPSGSTVFKLLFRVRDNYQLLDSADLVYPFEYEWLCSTNGGADYSALAGCKYNNSTTRVHEIAGTIPAAWDGLEGFDTDPRPGRVTAEGYVTRFGDLAPACAAPGVDCFPIKMVGAYVGNYGTQLIDDKINQFGTEAQPERDIYFCNGAPCSETDAGAVSSGWIGSEN